MQDKQGFSLEKTVFTWGCWVGFFFCIFQIPMVLGVLSQAHTFYSLILGAVCYPIVFYYGVHFDLQKTFWPNLILTLFILTHGWFLSQGISGATPLAFLLAIVAFVQIYSEDKLKKTVVAFTLNVLALVSVDWFLPELIVRYESELAARFDSSFTFFLVFGFSLAMLVATRKSYERERKVVKEQNELLQKRELELEKAKDKAEANSRAKSEFLSVMSHEIRTPLNAVLGISEYLELEAQNDESLESLKTLRTSANSLLSLVNDILDFSKIEAGKLSLEKSKFDLTLLVRSLVDLFRGQASEKRVELELEIGRKVPDWVEGDSVRLNQVLINLMSNALKFTKVGSVKLTVDMIHSSLINFEVSDTGIGIAPENHAKIFKRFTQASSSTTREFGGTGLGLTISAKLVHLMGGKLCLESEVGHGSKFSFQLNLPRVSPDESMQLSLIEQKKAACLADKKVLVVEDNPVNVMVVKKFLSRWKMQIGVAENGELGVQLYTEYRPDIILMDLQMPVMDGLDAARKIRKLEGNFGTSVPIIALTASVLLEDRKMALQAGMDDYLPKPFRAEQLFQVLTRYLS